MDVAFTGRVSVSKKVMSTIFQNSHWREFHKFWLMM